MRKRIIEWPESQKCMGCPFAEPVITDNPDLVVVCMARRCKNEKASQNLRKRAS